VDLHWRIGPRFATDALGAEEVFGRSDVVDLLGERTPTLGRAHTVLAHTLHAATHEWSRLEDVASLCGLLQQFTDQDWHYLSQSAHEHDSRRRLAVGLCLARDIGGLPLPRPALTLADYRGADRLAKEAQAFLLGSRPTWWARVLRLVAGPKGDDSGSVKRFGRIDRALGVLWQAQTLDTWQASVRHLERRLMASGAHDLASVGHTGPAWLPSPVAQLLWRQQRLWTR